MELHHRLVRQTINIAISKAMEDMKSNMGRSIRQLIDLGSLFSKSENQKWFFNTAKKAISNPKNPYNSLVARMISDVNNETIKKVGLNLGYNSLTYGANKLRKSQESMKCTIPWLLLFDIAESCSVFFHQIKDLIREGLEMGIYSYVFCLHEADDLIPLCEIAKQFDECLFIFKALPECITDQNAQSLGEVHNAAVSIHVEDCNINGGCYINAFRILKQNRCFYGFHLNYKEDNIEIVATPEYIRSAIELGNLFGIYQADAGVPEERRDAVYTFVCNERGEAGQPLIALEWSHDIRDISERILSGGGCMAVHLAGKAKPLYCMFAEFRSRMFFMANTNKDLMV